MSDTKFQAHWRALAERWGLSVEAPFRVEVSGASVEVPVLLRDFGALRGMLLVTDFDLIAKYASELVDQGYGFSCLSEPSGAHGPADDDAFVEMLGDWGWSGMGAPPSWYRDGGS